MRTGDIVFVRGNSLVSKAIETIDGHWSHCCVALDENFIIEAQGGIRSRISSFSYTNYEVVPMHLPDDKYELALEAAISLLNKKYDYKQIIGILIDKLFFQKFHHLWNSTGEMICSELCVDFLIQVGLMKDTTGSRGMTPNELYRYLKGMRSH